MKDTASAVLAGVFAFTALLGTAVFAPASARADSPGVSRGDAQAVFQAFGTGGLGIRLHGGTFVEGAPADYGTDSMARIAAGPPSSPWNGRHYCALDWHVICMGAVEGEPAGGPRTNGELLETLDQVIIRLTLDGELLETERTAPKRYLNPAQIASATAFYVNEGLVMAPEELSVGTHTLEFWGLHPAPGRTPTIFTVTFFIDPPGEGTCL